MRRPALAFGAVVALALVLALPAGARAPKPASGPWSGNAAVFELSFKVAPDGESVESLNTNWTALTGCSIPISDEVHTSFGPMKIKNGHFKGSVSEEEGGRISVEGDFTSSTKATGRFSADLPVKGFPVCKGSTPFQAKHR
jgi:hypothetical protein